MTERNIYTTKEVSEIVEIPIKHLLILSKWLKLGWRAYPRGDIKWRKTDIARLTNLLDQKRIEI